MKKKVDTVCDHCGVIFSKDSTEVTRNAKLGRRNYCSRKCCGHANHSQIIPFQGENAKYIKGMTQRDEFTGLRDFVRRAKNRKKDINVTVEYLKEVWDKQGAKCPYSGVTLELPRYDRKNNPIYTASLDRIDSAQGYIEGNVQFISIAMNTMKNDMSHEQTLLLIELIKQS